jgi:hypothetical protein
VVTFGRGQPNPLAGPLAQVLQSREVDKNGLDVIYWICDGKANHAGDGVWNGITGNYKLLGNEIEWSGPDEPFGPKRVLSSELVMRAFLDCCENGDHIRTAFNVAEHREYALPKGRKIDTNLNGNIMRNRMGDLLINKPIPEEDFMATMTEAEKKALMDSVESIAEIKRLVFGQPIGGAFKYADGLGDMNWVFVSASGRLLQVVWYGGWAIRELGSDLLPNLGGVGIIRDAADNIGRLDLFVEDTHGDIWCHTFDPTARPAVWTKTKVEVE